MVNREFWFGLTAGFGLGVTTFLVFHTIYKKDTTKVKRKPRRHGVERPQYPNEHTRNNIPNVNDLEEIFFRGIDRKAQLSDEQFNKLKAFLRESVGDQVDGIRSLEDLLHLMRRSRLIQGGQYRVILTILEQAHIGIDRDRLMFHIVGLQQAYNDIQEAITPVFELDDFELDVLILHTDQDRLAAFHFKKHLIEDGGVHGLSVQTYEEFHINDTVLKALGDVFKRSRYVFIYMTVDMVGDEFQRFVTEMTLTESLNNPRKRHRIVPVWATEERLSVPELNVFPGVAYWKSNDEIFRESYQTTLNKLLVEGRTTFVRA